MPIRVEHHELGPRLWVGPVRIHHWHAGLTLLLAGAWLIWVDRSDLPRSPS